MNIDKDLLRDIKFLKKSAVQQSEIFEQYNKIINELDSTKMNKELTEKELKNKLDEIVDLKKKLDQSDSIWDSNFFNRPTIKMVNATGNEE